MNENEAKYLLEIMEAYPTAAQMAKVVVDLEKQLKEMGKLADYYKIECEKLETELESKGKLHKINLNDPIKVKLTPYGAEIYYHQFDDINKQYGRQVIEPHMPTIDKDGYTKFLLHGFMELYGEYMYAGARNVIEPIEIIACD